MAHRGNSKPSKLNNNYEAKDYISLGPNFAITVNDPVPNADSNATFSIYSFTKENNQHNQIFNESGSYKILNDKGIEIAAGNKGSDGNVDICITGLGGDIWITATSTGAVKIKAHTVMIEAGEDLDLKAGRNINLNAGSGRIAFKADKIDQIAINGNAVLENFPVRAFSLSHISDAVKDLTQGKDLLSSILSSVGIG
jgi:hypothetical protein